MAVIKIIINLILIILALIAVAAVSLRVAGFTPYIIESDSMSPLYNSDDIIFVKKILFKNIKETDIITFINLNNNVVTHRVMSIDENKKELITKGDNNKFVDINPVSEENIIGKVYFKIPKFGNEINKIKNFINLK